MFGPWERIAEPYGQMVLGYFGKTPVPPDPEVVRIASEQLGLEPTTQPPIERNDADPDKGVDAATRQLNEAGLEATEENIFIVAACKEKGLAYLQGQGEIGVRKVEKQAEPAAAAGGPASYRVTVNGRSYGLQVEDGRVTVDGTVYQVDLSASEAAPTGGAGGSAAGGRP